MNCLILAVTAIWFKILPPAGTYPDNCLERINGLMLRSNTVLTTNDLKRVAEELNNRVLDQGRIILDHDHESTRPGFDESHVVGDMMRFRSNEDGSVDALTVLTDYGRELTSMTNGWYVSPAFTKRKHIGSTNYWIRALVSAAITTHPHTDKCPLVSLGTAEVWRHPEYGYWEVEE